MVGKLAKLASIVLCFMMIADLSAVISVNMYEETSPNPLAGPPKTIWVDDDFVDDPPNHKWDSIQEGVDDAIDGDTVYVFNGFYKESIIVDRPLNLIGEGSDFTVIDFKDKGSTILVTSDWVNISGFTVSNMVLPEPNRGIRLYQVENCRVTQNNLTNNGQQGVFLDRSSNNTVANNSFSWNQDGVTLEGYNNTVTNNTFFMHSLTSVKIVGSDYNIVSHNRAYNDGGGIYLQYADWNIIYGNTVEKNILGVNFYVSHGNIISNNTFSENLEGINLMLSTNNKIHHNNILDNEHQAIDDYASDNDWHHPLILEGNCWSDYTGLDDGSGVDKHAISSDGIGDTLIPHPGSDFDYYPLAGPKCQIPPLNSPPVADAGLDQTVNEGDIVQFDGTGSFDPDAGWVTTTVDTLIFQNVFASMALDSRDFPGIGYSNVTDRDLRYAKWNGTAWEYATVDSPDTGGGPSLDFNGSDYPSMSYRGGDNDLKYAWWNGTGWNNRTVDSLGRVGQWSSLAIGDDDRPRISYYDYGNQDLKYAWWNGTAWLNETVDSFGPVGTDTSLAIDRYGNPHISYIGELRIGSQQYNRAKYAWKNGSVWDIQFVSLDPGGAVFTSLALDRNDSAHISYLDSAGLMYASWNGNAWKIELLDYTTGPIIVGGLSSIALDSRDYPHISYADGKNGTLKHTFWNGTAWTIETVDNATWDTTSLAIDGNDIPHISYFSGANLDLKYAKKGGGIVSYDWDFGDGSPPETGARPTHVYGDNGNYTVTLKVTDNAGLSDTDTCLITVLNVAPTADANGPYHGFEGTPVHFDGNHTDPGANDTHTYEWDFSYDGTTFIPDATGNPYQKTWFDDYSGNIALKVTDDDGGWDLDVTAVTVVNVPPRAEAGEDKEGHEVSTFTFNGSFYDPGANDTHEYAWDFDYDGISFDVEATGQSVSHTFVDDFDGDIAFSVTDDDGGVGIDTAHVLVKNVPPTVTLEVLPMEVDAFLRIAGEKWHDVSIELYADGILMANGTLVRYPGSPNDQMLDLSNLQFDYSKNYTATVTYTPEDDPVNGQPNGANPCWIIMRFSDGQELWIHHTFNVQHPETYVWEVDLTAAILSHGMTFKATASDPGADDLTFHWDFGDGTNATSFYPNGNGTYPVTIMEIINHVFPGSGTYTVTVTVEDDDGGIGVAMITVTIP